MVGLAATSSWVMACYTRAIEWIFRPARYPEAAGVAMACGLAKASLWSRLFDGCPQPGKRVAQVLVGNAGEIRCHRRGRDGVGRGAGLLLPAAERSLPQLQAADRAPAEEPVHPLQHHVGKMLDFDRGRALDPQHQRARCGRLALAPPRPPDPFRFRMGGDLRARDLRPAGDELGRGEALLGEGVAQRLVQKVLERTRIRIARL